jgi:Subtilase family/PA domain/Fibronectin type-III domain
LSRSRKGQRALARKLPFIVALAALGALIAASSSASSSAKLTAIPLGSDSIVSTYTAAKSDSGRIARTSPALLALKSARPVNVMIKYDFDATASYTGGVAGLRATSPRATGVKLALNKAAVKAYGRFTARYVRSVNRAIHARISGVQIRQVYRTAYGGVAAQVPGNSIAKLLKVPGVVAVQKDTLQRRLDDNTTFIGATAVWPSLGGPSNAGSNVVIGVLDTGIWPEHPMMSPAGIAPPAGGLKGCQFGDGSDTAHLGPTFACNNKLIGAYSKMATYMSVHGADANEFCNNTTHVCSPRDSEGHGTHTTTTAGGGCVTTAVLYGVERGPVCGIAPGAHIEMFRVCGSAGCFSSDSVSAVNQAITDGVNVINFSISGGASPYSDPVELAFLDATNAGISVNASAGNSGPGAGTSDHGGPWTTTVGASTGPRSFTSTLHLTADAGATLDVPGVTLTNGISTATPVVLAATLPKAGGGNEDALCQSDVAAGAATGKVVVCSRGGNGRIDKGRRVLAGGAAGMILYNQSAAVTDLESDNHYLPAIQTQFNSNSIATFVMGHTNVMATWAQGTASPAQADVMASFSSRGPTGDWIKPDITAPGVQVLAGMTPQPDQTTADNGPPGNLYQAIAGTSMSSPHAAGVSALVKAAHPTWTPEEIKSALMTSSVQAVVKEDGTTPATPFDDGAGSIRADRAVSPTLVFNETYANFVAAGTDTIHRIDLNIPNIDATTMSGSVTTQRTAINVSGAAQTMQVQVTQPAGVTITVGNKNHALHIANKGTLTFPITISAPTVANGQYFGAIRLVPQDGGNSVYMPVAFVKKQGNVTLSNICSPGSFAAVTGLTHCTATVQNLGSAAANADLNIAMGDHPEDGVLRYRNVGQPGGGTPGNVQWSGTLSPAIPPQVTAINNVTGQGPDGGYLALGLLGVPATPGVGDDTISNFSVPTFYYGGEPYTSVGIVSNGYIVVGGGTSADIVFRPQNFPNAARPNNTLAALWTDLNPSATGAGAIRVAILRDGPAGAPTTTAWLVADWAGVKNFGNATTHSFNIWIRLASGAAGTGPASEQITYSYGPNQTFPGDGPGLGNAGIGDPDSGINWGAENRTGSSGVNIATAPANGSEYRVVTSPPTPGGQVTIPYDITANLPGSYTSIASMTSDQTPGVTQIVTPLTVTP